MMVCVCGTPLQIMNAINLSLTTYKDEDMDLIILDHSNDNFTYYNNLKSINLFQNVYFIKSRHFNGGNSENRVFRYFKTVKKIINSKELINQLVNKKSKYTQFFICSPDIPSQIIYYHFKKK